MRTGTIFLLLCGLCLFAPLRWTPSASAADLSVLGRATVQHDSTLKTVDTISRDVISQLSGRSKLPDEHPVETIFGFSYTPEAYASRPFIKIRHLPLRQDIAASLVRPLVVQPER
ncbi:MAG: hypothetical protein AAF561_16465, partial [Planctomycetota bacterium]